MKKFSLILFLSCILIPCSYGAVSDTYKDDDVSVSFKRTYLKKAGGFCIDLNVKILAENKFIKPNTDPVDAIDIDIFDNFGNDLDYRGISPMYGWLSSKKVLRPGEEKTFTIRFSVKPLETTKYLLLKIPIRIFGNINPFELKIPKPTFELLAPPSFAEIGNKTESSDTSFETLKKENDGITNKVYLGIFIGLSALCSLGLIYFLCRKLAKKIFLCCKSFFLLLPQWVKQNHLHFLILKILSALVCLGWLIIGIMTAIDDNENISWLPIALMLMVLLCVVGLWVIYFAVYGIIRLICIAGNRTTRILWFGMIAFIAWCVLAVILDLYFRQFTPVALIILTITGSFIYTFRNKDSKKKGTCNKNKRIIAH